MFEGDEDPFVPVWEGPTPQGELVLRKIEAAHIPVDFGEPPAVGHARVEVPRSYREEARAAIDGPGPSVSFDIGEEIDGFDWAPVLRIALVVVAVILVIALVLY
ncbi:MAG: hypothetical protein ACREQY_09330 [Candidatus Binatia bacterium]